MKKKISRLPFADYVTLYFFFCMAQTDSAAATKPEKFVTKHSVKIDNKLVSYTATAGTLIQKNEKR
jgi:hypothetical protein